MQWFKVLFLEIIFVSTCFCETNLDQENFTYALLHHLNNLADQQSAYGEPVLHRIEKIGEDEYYIEIKVKLVDFNDVTNHKCLNCSAIGTKLSNAVVVSDAQCNEIANTSTHNIEELVKDFANIGGTGYSAINAGDGTEHTVGEPILLENEIQPNTAYISGEQFVAIPREQPAPCIGCSTIVDSHAVGVNELVTLGVRQLDRHEPNTRHSLNNVLLVERQVQVVGGVRYTVTFDVDYDNCTTHDTEGCTFQKTCKVAVLEKPWKKLPDGSKFRAILSNNCTEEWLFDENADNPPNKDNIPSTDDDIVVVQKTELQAQPALEKTLTEDQIKDLEEQIIPYSKVSEPALTNAETANVAQIPDMSDDHTSKLVSTNVPSSNQHPDGKKEIKQEAGLSTDQKRAVDELINFFELINSNSRQNVERKPPMSRSSSSENSFINRKEQEREKRSVNKLVGGQKEEDIHDTRYENLAQESLHKFVQTTGTTQHYKVTKIDKVTVQVVSGKLTSIDFTIAPTNCQVDASGRPTSSNCEIKKNPEFINCRSSIWERPWLKSKEIDIECNFDNKKSRRKRHIRFSGNDLIENPDDTNFFKLAEDSLKQYLLAYSVSIYYVVSDIEEVKKVEAPGELIKIDFKAVPTNCTSSEAASNPAICVRLNSDQTFSCHLENWMKPPLNSKIMNVNCQINEKNLRRRRQLIGGENEQSVTDPKYRNLAEEAVAQYVSSSGITQHYKVTKIYKVTTQAVSGLMTKIVFKVAPTTCEVDSDGRPTSSNCKIRNSQGILRCHGDIWEQPWLSKKGITVKCTPVKRRFTRAIITPSRTSEKELEISKEGLLPGGEAAQKTDDPKYFKLVEESLAKYVTSTGIRQHHKPIEIIKVATQVVSGIKTKIDFRASATNCEVDNTGYPTSSICAVQNPQNVLICHSEIWEQTWLNKKEIEISCSPVKLRSKRHLPGGEKTQDSSDPKFFKLAEESLAKFVTSSGIKQHHKPITIRNVVTQVVAGQFTKINFTASITNCEVDGNGAPTSSPCEIQNLENVINCYAEIWERPWLKQKDIEINCSPVESRSKRQVRGGEKVQDQRDPKFFKLAEESLAKFVTSSGIKQHHKPITIRNVVTQAVAGQLTKINFTASITNCEVDGNGAPTSFPCEIQNPENVTYCYAEIWERPWLKQKDIEINCSPVESRSKRQVLGGEKVQDQRDPKFFKLAEESLAKFVTSSGIKQYHKPTEIQNVVTQVVAGQLTKMDFKASVTNCLVDSNGVPTSSSCQLQNPENVINCHAEIWEKPWLNQKNITVSCSPSSTRRKRNVLSGEEIQDPHNSKFLDLALQSLDVYQKKSKLDKDHKLIKIDRVSTLLVSGILTKIDFSILPATCPNENSHRNKESHCKILDCHSEIWEQPWMKNYSKAIEVSCDDMRSINNNLNYYSVENVGTSMDESVLLSDSLTRRSRAGGEQEQNPENPQYKRLALESLKKYQKLKKSEYSHKVIKVNRVLRRVVSGIIYKIDYVASQTTCPANVPEMDLEMCKPVENATLYCYTEIWDRPWMKRKKIDVYCGPEESDDSEEESTVTSRKRWNVRHGKQEENEIPIIAFKVPKMRAKRSVSTNLEKAADQDVIIQKLLQESLEKLEMQSVHHNKQRVFLINSYSSKTGKVKETTIDFDVGYTNCLKYEWVDNITKCEFLENLPLRHCVAHVTERPLSNNDRQTEVSCSDDVSPLDGNMEIESNEGAITLANEALKRIEYKYPNARRAKVIRIFSIEKQMAAGIHYRIKLEIGYTKCMALSEEQSCELDSDVGSNKFCKVNVWVRPGTNNNHPPSYRVSCDYHEEATGDLYHDLQAQALFIHFLQTHKPVYLGDHLKMQERYAIFKANVKRIHELNVYEMGTARYAVTKYADLSPEEFGRMRGGWRADLREENQVPMPMAQIPEGPVPAAFDWRDHGAVTEVKDQGMCGSCWAFSVTGNIEGQWKKHSGKLLSLSEQELVDCDTLDSGCNGGLPDNAYRAIEQLGGLETESDYPYEGDKEKCAYNSTLSRVRISGAVNVTNNETDMAKWLVANGPISIGINANAMQFYMGGVSHPWRMLCNPKNLDHGVLIVGYGEKDYPLFHKKLPYWTVKNSWGPRWGEQGYYRVYRGDGTCGVNQMASSAVV